MRKALWALLLIGLLLVGCQGVPQEGEALGATAAPTSVPTPVPPRATEKLIIDAAPLTSSPTVPPTPSPTPSPSPTPTPEPTPLGLLPWTMGDLFSFQETIDREYDYVDDTISIHLTRYEDTERTGRALVYFVADIYVQNIESFRRAYCSPVFGLGMPKPIQQFSEENNAILAMSGDYCSHQKKAFVVINGEVVHDTGMYEYDLCVLYRDGILETIPANRIDPKKIMAGEPWQTWNFGPMLLDGEGLPLETFNLPDTIDGRNPRAAVGYYQPGHYCFVLVDGRQSGYSVGVSITELAELMQELGCAAAYNLDGGISAQIAWHGRRVNHPGQNRSILDILYITKE